MFKLIALAGTALVAATPALAQNVPADQATSAQKPKDPNRIICERDEETGSRLGAKRSLQDGRPVGRVAPRQPRAGGRLAAAADFTGQACRLSCPTPR